MKNTIKLPYLGCCLGMFAWAYASLLHAEPLEALADCESCHVQQASEYQESVHYINRSGVQAKCNNCHAFKVHEKGEKTSKVITKPRSEMAKSEWQRFGENQSKECKTCHSPMAMDLAKQEPRSVERHEESFNADNTSCISCHQGISHHLPSGAENLKLKK